MPRAFHQLLRARDGHEASVSNAELFFDLIYVFAVTQLSHRLLADLSLTGALETLLLWFAVWLAWQYTAWMTNWFDPESKPVRLLLFAIMGVGLVLAAALPQAFAGRALVVGACFAAIQLGRTLSILVFLGSEHQLTANYQRILGWQSLSAALWLAGGISGEATRLALWALAVLAEYVAPMVGFWLPGLGRSDTRREWTIEGGHLAERCQLFVIVALGEAILITGATLSALPAWDAPVLIATLVAFVGSLAMWWVYFDTGCHAATEAIAHADDPGRLGARFHYVHVALVGAIIVNAVGNELVIAHPDGHIEPRTLAVLIGGPALYLLANALFKRLIYGGLPLSHLVGLALLAALTPFGPHTDLLMVGGLTTVILMVVAIWESVSRGRAPTPARHGVDI
ncbi:low temperature requirement protein A [Neisseriaceae bacterium JH1-16]|nr:low temperature requirement protein A [Neisseriaceae bacterium JH1-16]